MVSILVIYNLACRDIVKNNVGTVTFTETVSSNDNEGNVTFSIIMTNSSGNRIHITTAILKMALLSQ